jgi:hypothetical protein
MAIDFRTVFINFDASRQDVREQKATVVFNQPVNKFVAALQGWDIQFSESDRPFGRFLIELFSDRAPGTNNAVDVTVRYLLRDFTPPSQIRQTMSTKVPSGSMSSRMLARWLMSFALAARFDREGVQTM